MQNKVYKDLPMIKNFNEIGFIDENFHLNYDPHTLTLPDDLEWKISPSKVDLCQFIYNHFRYRNAKSLMITPEHLEPYKDNILSIQTKDTKQLVACIMFKEATFSINQKLYTLAYNNYLTMDKKYRKTGLTNILIKKALLLTLQKTQIKAFIWINIDPIIPNPICKCKFYHSSLLTNNTLPKPNKQFNLLTQSKVNDFTNFINKFNQNKYMYYILNSKEQHNLLTNTNLKPTYIYTDPNGKIMAGFSIEVFTFQHHKKTIKFGEISNITAINITNFDMVKICMYYAKTIQCQKINIHDYILSKNEFEQLNFTENKYDYRVQTLNFNCKQMTSNDIYLP